MAELNIGDKFKATDKLGKTANWIVLNKIYYPERGVNYPFYDLMVIGDFAKEMVKEYKAQVKKDLKQFAYVNTNIVNYLYLFDVEQPWLNERKIEVIENVNLNLKEV